LKSRSAALIALVLALAVAAPRAASGGRSAGDQTEVERDSLVTMIRRLSILDSDPLTCRTRFTYREAELAESADFLADRLQRYTGNAVQRRHFTVSDAESTYTAENIVGYIAGTGQSGGRMLITAHFDATASRSPGWDTAWTTMPAPGADDNATGVAALMEVARIIDYNELPFDVEFVLFSAEELGKLGSIEYLVGCDADCADSILGVINLDMLGYRTGGELDGTIMANYRSGWLSELMFLQMQAPGGDAPTLREIKPGPSNWDHASFWEHDPPISAVTIAEPLGGEFGTILYPHYHTVKDTLENVDFHQLEDLTVCLLGFLERFALVPAELALLQSDLLIKRGEIVIDHRVFTPGEEIILWVRARSIGGTNPQSGSGFTLTVALENSRGRRTLYSGEFEVPELLRAREVQIPLTLDASYAGDNRVTASMAVYGFDDLPENNTAEDHFVVKGGENILLSHSFQPNPVAASFRDARFCINLASEANCIVEIYTIEGEVIDQAYLGVSYGKPLEAGLNCLECGDIFRHVERLASGIYIYRLKLYSLDNAASQYTGRFAVEH
jgi:hypothetical protein